MQDNGSKHKEQLKQKQAEFEEEMKKKTKHLKPRVIGSLWMADANNNPGIFFFNENDCGLKKDNNCNRGFGHDWVKNAKVLVKSPRKSKYCIEV